MLKDKLLSLIEGQRSYGIDLRLTEDGIAEVFFVESSLRKDEVIITRKLKSKNLEELFSSKLEETVPIFLNIRGRGILSKKVSHQEEVSDLNLIKMALPNVKANELYFYSEKISKEHTWIQFVRKSIVDEVFRKFGNAKLNILSLTLGITELNNIVDYIGVQRVVVDSDIVEFTGGRLSGTIETSEPVGDVKLGEDLISSQWLMSYSAAFNHFVKRGVYGVQSEYTNIEKIEFINRKLFGIGLKIVLTFFLATLLLNFFLFQNFTSTYDNYYEQLQLNRSYLDRLNQLQEEKENKDKFFLKTDLVSASNSVYYADRLASSKPNGITWDELNINPSIKRKIQKGEDIEFKIKTINVSGQVESSVVLNQWIEILKNESWIKNINIKGFQIQENNQTSKFNLQIDVL